MRWGEVHRMVKEDTNGGSDDSLLYQTLDGILALIESLRTAVRVRLTAIPSVEEALRDLVTFAFVALYLFSMGRRHSSVLAELLHHT